MTGTSRTSTDQSRIPVSIVMAIYNGERYLTDSLGSIANQSALPAQVVLVDDGSTDSSPDALAAWSAELAARRIRVDIVRQKNAGQSAARNRGLENVTEPYVVFFDQDDVMLTEHLHLLWQAISCDAEMSWCTTPFSTISSTGDVLSSNVLTDMQYVQPASTVPEFLAGNLMMLPSASLIRSAHVRAVGGFDTRFRGYEDDDLFTRLLAAGGKFQMLGMPTLLYRLHEVNSSASKTYRESRMAFFHKWLGALRQNDEDMGVELLSERIFRSVFDDLVRAEKTGDRQLGQECVSYLQDVRRSGRLSMRSQCIIAVVGVPKLFRLLLRARRLI